jgi:NodT family efflux transporter outer membrane factor (OMF) lipoprotein
VAAAERRVAAANAQIGVARAAFYPALTLDASGGFESAWIDHLFTLPARFWSVGPQASVALFDAGQRSAVETEAEAGYDEAAANYRATVLGAFRDVEDSLASLRELDTEVFNQAGAAHAAYRSLVQARLRYAGGIVTYLDVVTAQSTLLQAELAFADARTRRTNASIALIKALGGGWQPGDAAHMIASAPQPDRR